MKALIIIAACLVLAFLFRVIDQLSSRRVINSVGARANSRSKDMARIDINDANQLKEALEHYKDLID